MTEVPARAALLLTEATGAGVLAVRRAERMEDVIAVVAAFGRATYASDDANADPRAVVEGDRVLRVAATFVAGGLAQTIDAWLRGPGAGLARGAAAGSRRRDRRGRRCVVRAPTGLGV